MHLFHDSTLNTWRLIAEKLPEKPVQIGKEFSGHHQIALEKYEYAVAALKQNALTVGNPEIIDELIRVNKNWINGNPIPDELYFWPGGYTTKEKREWVWYDKKDNLGSSKLITVAILTLPEEKKNNYMKTAKEIIFDNSKEVTITMHNAEMCMRVYAIGILRELKARLGEKITSEIHEVECSVIDNLIHEV